jgi:hypothetical protein
MLDLLLIEWVTKMKPGSNSVEFHPQQSHNGHPVDVALVGGGSLWPPNMPSWSACKQEETKAKAAQPRPGFFCEFCEVAGMGIIIQKRWPQPNLGEVEKFRHVAMFLLHTQTCCLNLAISEFLYSKSGKFEQFFFW